MAVLYVPFLYRTRIVRIRRRKEEEVLLVGSAPFGIREMTSTEAPVAMRAVHVRPDPRGGAGRPVEIVYRTVGGRLMRPLVVAPEADGDFDPAGTVTLAGAEEAFARLRADMFRRPYAAWPVMPWLRDAERLYGNPEDEDRVEVKEWLALERGRNLDRDRMVARIQRELDEAAAVVDGVVHVPSMGPCWTINSSYRTGPADRWGRTVGVGHVSVRLWPERGWLGSRCEDSVFAPESVDRALAEARRRHGGQADVVVADDPVGSVAFHEGPRCGFDEDFDAMCKALHDLIRLLRGSIGDAAPEAIRAYADLKEALAALDDPASPERERALMTGLALSRLVGDGLAGPDPLARYMEDRAVAAATHAADAEDDLADLVHLARMAF